VPTFADKGRRVVSATDPHGRILDFLDQKQPTMDVEHSFFLVVCLAQYSILRMESVASIETVSFY
jgi:hypothetical protein